MIVTGKKRVAREQFFFSAGEQRTRLRGHTMKIGKEQSSVEVLFQPKRSELLKRTPTARGGCNIHQIIQIKLDNLWKDMDDISSIA